MRAVVLGALVVLGLACIARADDSAATLGQSGRGKWPELYEEYRKAHEAHGDVLTEISSVDRLLMDAEARLAPLRAIAAQIASTCPDGDPRRAEADMAVLRRVYELHVGENRARRAQLAERELATREDAIRKGGVALQAVLEHLERLGRAMIGREDQIAGVRSTSLILMQQLDLLENQGTPLLAPFTPLGTPNNPGQIVQLIKIYEEDAARSSVLAASLADRLAVKKAQREPLLKVQAQGVMMVDENRIRLLDERIEEIDRARLAALKRAEELRQEIVRLKKVAEKK